MDTRILNVIKTIGWCFVTGCMVKKLNCIQKEVEYLEEREGIFLNRKEYNKKLDELIAETES